jgi:4-amino-4-deoxy-L-arabinose transferase-like glycosyltransferase
MRDFNTKQLLLTVILLSAVVRVATTSLFFSDYRPEQDAREWHQAAINLLQGHGLIVNENLKAYRTPVPGLLFATIYSVFGVSVRAVQMANVLLGVITVWLTYDLVKRSFGPRSAFLAANFVSFYPLLLFYTGQMLSETPVIILIALGLWLAWVFRNDAAVYFAPVGVVMGLAVLTRETVFPIAVFIAVWSFGVRRTEQWRRRCLPALVILSFMVVTIAPWAIRNYVLLGRFVPLTSQGGLSLWIANNPEADGSGLGDHFSPVPQFDVLPEVERGRAYQKLAIGFIAENPARFAELMLRRITYFWHLGYHGDGLAEVAFLLVYLPTLTLATLGLRAGWRSNRDATLLLLIVPVSLTMLHSIFLPVGRYRLPAELIICMFAGLGLNWSLSKVLTSKIV